MSHSLAPSRNYIIWARKLSNPTLVDFGVWCETWISQDNQALTPLCDKIFPLVCYRLFSK